jgi:hypothetical protein
MDDFLFRAIRVVLDLLDMARFAGKAGLHDDAKAVQEASAS